jgi:protoheme IX farnesyltransferase
LDYVLLAKPRSVLLLLITALTGMVVASPGLPSAVPQLVTVLAGAMAAGGANALNCYLDRDLDRRMARTSLRPLAAGTLQPARALLFGLGLCTAAFVLFAVGVNWLSAMLAAAGAFYYVVVYTLWLKRSSHWNVVIGGVAGSIPLLVGSAAASGQVSPLALWLGVVVLLWTPPHFWSLALVRRREYAAAGVPMLPVSKGEAETRRQILIYSVLLLLSTLLLMPAGLAGPLFLLVSLILGAIMLFMAARLIVSASDAVAARLYRYSIVYLALLFISVILDRAVGWLTVPGIS